MEVQLEERSVEPLLAEWEELFAADPGATPFVSPAFARAWWPHWAGSARPWIVVIRDGGRPVGLAPFVLRRRGPFRVLGELGRDPSNYWDVLALPGRRPEVLSLVAAEVARRRAEWDALLLGGLGRRSPTADALSEPGLRVHRRSPVRHPGIELPASFDEYLEGLPRKRRKDLRRHLRRLDEGELEMRELQDAAEISAAIDRWQEMRVAWWRARGKAIDPEHASERFREFIRDLMLLAVPAGLGLVWAFEHRGTPVGVEISLVTERCFYSWLDGYDPAAAQLGLGKVAVGVGIRSSIEAGRSYFDFMIGDESYKYWFGAKDRYGQWLMFTHPAWRSRLAAAAGAAIGSLRRSRRSRAGGALDAPPLPSKQPSDAQ
jgi:CelD/BcsL family acetyltransferase involved in cellulose biosynthesis